jgi:hypothetical protein
LKEEAVETAKNQLLGMRRVDYLANINEWRPEGTKKAIRGMELHRFYHSDHRNARPPQTNPPENLVRNLASKEAYQDSSKFFTELGLKEAWDAYHGDKFSRIYDDSGLINQLRDGRGKNAIFDEEVWMKGRVKAPKAPKAPKAAMTAEQLEARRTEGPHEQRIRLEKRMREMRTQQSIENELREKRERAEANKRDRELRGLNRPSGFIEKGTSGPVFQYGSHPQFGGRKREEPSKAPMMKQMEAALVRQKEERDREEEARREARRRRHYASETNPMTQGFRELYDEENFWERTGGSDFWVPSRPSGYENLSFEEKYGED